MDDKLPKRSGERPSPEGERQIKNSIAAARTKLRKAQTNCFRDDDHPHTGIKRLDTDLVVSCSTEYGTSILNAIVSAFWSVWSERNNIDREIERIVQDLRAELNKRWKELNSDLQQLLLQ